MILSLYGLAYFQSKVGLGLSRATGMCNVFPKVMIDRM